MIGLLKILSKQLATVIGRTRYLPNSKSLSSQISSTVGFLILSRNFFRLGQFSSFDQNLLFCFAAGYYSSLVTVDVSLSAEFSAPDSMGINSQKSTTSFAQTVNLIFFLRSLRLAFSCFGLMNFYSSPSPS